MSAKIEIEMDGKLGAKDAELMLSWWRALLSGEQGLEEVKLSFPTLKPKAILVVEAPSAQIAQAAWEALGRLARERSM